MPETPYQILGIPVDADREQVHTAYRNLVKQHHPDRFPDPEEKAAAHEKLVRINLAYEQVLKLAPVKRASEPIYTREIPMEESLKLAEKMLRQDRPEAALRHLKRAIARDHEWFWLKGRCHMLLEEYREAHEAFREAVRRRPEDREYHRLAFEAEMALKKSETAIGKIKSIFRKK